MIHCEQYRAEEISELDTYILFQRNEAESPKEKFFEERIHDGYVDCHPYKVVRCDTHSICQAGSHAAEINNVSQSKISTENHTKDDNTKQKWYKQAFLMVSADGITF